MDMRSVAGLIGERFRRQRSEQALLERDATDRLAQFNVVVGGGQRLGMADGDLVLAVA